MWKIVSAMSTDGKVQVQRLKELFPEGDAKKLEPKLERDVKAMDLTVEDEQEEVNVEEDLTATQSLEGSDEEMDDDSAKCEAIQAAVALEVRAWLADHGVQLFALECSKKIVKDQKAAIKKGEVEPSRQFIQRIDLKRDLPLESTITLEGNKRRRIGTRVR